MMIGISTGAKNNLSLKHFKKLDSIPTKELIILGTSMKSVGRTYCLKMLKNLKELLIKKGKLNKLMDTTLFLSPIIYLINILSFSNNLKDLAIKLFGL